jgi:hypothetical protein
MNSSAPEKRDLSFTSTSAWRSRPRAPWHEGFRVMFQQAGGIRATDPVHEKNFAAIVEVCRPPALLIWASTTPSR